MMIKGAIQKIQELAIAGIEPLQIGSRFYSEKNLSEIKPPAFTSPDSVPFNTLQGIVDFIKTMAFPEGAFLHVKSETGVFIRGPLDPANYNKRFVYATTWPAVESFVFGRYFDAEAFVIAIQSMFVQDEDAAAVIAVMGALANEKVVEQNDDGMNQAVQVKTGITTKSQVTISNPVTLRPFRTFSEVIQPASKFIIRMQEKAGIQIALFEADGGAWKIEAIENIKKWLADNTELPVIG